MGTYRPRRQLSKRERAEILLAADDDGTLVVSKRLSREPRDPAALTRLRRDAERAASLDHPNIARIREVIADESACTIVMEYVSGETLRDLLRGAARTVRRVPFQVSCAILDGAAAGLTCAHEAADPAGEPSPIAHRGLTTSNLMVTYTGRLKIADFGIAEALHDAVSSAFDRPRDELRFRAPEQLGGGGSDHRADLFSLGVVVWELLTSCHLFAGASERELLHSILERHIPPPSRFHPEIPAKVDELVLALLRRDVADRMASARELRSALASAVSFEAPPEQILARWMTSAFEAAHTRRRAVEEAARSGDGPVSGDDIGDLPVGSPDPLSTLPYHARSPLSLPAPRRGPSASLPPAILRVPAVRWPISRGALLAFLAAAFAVPFLFVVVLRGHPAGSPAPPPAVLREQPAVPAGPPTPTQTARPGAATSSPSVAAPAEATSPSSPEPPSRAADDVAVLWIESEVPADDEPIAEASAADTTITRRPARRSRRPEAAAIRRPEPAEPEPETDATPDEPAERPATSETDPIRPESDTNPYVYK